MEENRRESPVITILKKAWPTIYRLINGAVYFIIMIIKSVVKGIISQLKGM